MNVLTFTLGYMDMSSLITDRLGEFISFVSAIQNNSSNYANQTILLLYNPTISIILTFG